MFLGIDIGTTAIKFGVISGRNIRHSHSIQLTTQIEGSTQIQSAKAIESALRQGIQALPAVLKAQIKTIAFSTAMHSFMPEKNGQGDAIYIWSDNQASQTIEAFRKTEKARSFYQETGTPIHAMSPFAKLLHLKEQGLLSSYDHFYGLKELTMRLFTGEVRIDRSTASATGLYALQEKTWSDAILAYLSVTAEQLAPLCEPTDCFLIVPELAEQLGLSQQVAVMCGASDGCLAAYAGYRSTGIPNSLTIGTSAAIRKVTSTPSFDLDKQNFCYYLKEGVYVVGAPSNNGGSVLAWAKETFAENGSDFFQALPHLLNETAIGSQGLRFFPYLNGERAPFWTNQVTAGFYHLTIAHRRPEMIRATIEGMLMNIRLLKDLVQVADQVTVSGGFFQTRALAQMTADVLGVACCLSEANEPIFGLYDLYDPTTVAVEIGETITPDPQSATTYQQIAPSYFQR
ncbi:gluconokinase [Enterococcus sp. RIT-PI-f]|uniref:gluconokinase n=1 Tax=Enterococcus sp. RIT-PI-f TaxID=1690244 RepID=UPI0006B9D80D|nr:FGGY family carbohydrate kinase [Enterococcus sp. RIT-PI-f]KPG69566.1 gluconokinase [Enterococcus sp. RIT-PI-f]